ncbi:MAG: hypothetical protein ACLU38_07150 [Dysosmobacter sp.]
MKEISGWSFPAYYGDQASDPSGGGLHGALCWVDASRANNDPSDRSVALPKAGAARSQPVRWWALLGIFDQVRCWTRSWTPHV